MTKGHFIDSLTVIIEHYNVIKREGLSRSLLYSMRDNLITLAEAKYLLVESNATKSEIRKWKEEIETPDPSRLPDIDLEYCEIIFACVFEPGIKSTNRRKKWELKHESQPYDFSNLKQDAIIYFARSFQDLDDHLFRLHSHIGYLNSLNHTRSK